MVLNAIQKPPEGRIRFAIKWGDKAAIKTAPIYFRGIWEPLRANEKKGVT